MNLLEGIPRGSGLSHRILQVWVGLWLAVIAAAVVTSHAAPGAFPIAGFAFTAMFIASFVVVPIAAFMQTRARRAVLDAEACLGHDPDAAYREARRALRMGPRGRESGLRAWLVVAQYAEERRDFPTADAALAYTASLTRWRTRSLWIRLQMRTAFVKAALGDLATAERHLLAFGVADRNDPQLCVEYVRAAAMIAYRQGRLRDVVNLATEAQAHALPPRDAALLTALARSSLLRLEAGGSPTRVAAPPPDPDEAWLESLSADSAPTPARSRGAT